MPPPTFPISYQNMLSPVLSRVFKYMVTVAYRDLYFYSSRKHISLTKWFSPGFVFTGRGFESGPLNSQAQFFPWDLSREFVPWAMLSRVGLSIFGDTRSKKKSIFSPLTAFN